MSNWYWSTFGKTESGDDLPVLLWASEDAPTPEMIDVAYHKLVPIEYEDVGHVCWRLAQAVWAESLF